ncbi:hypothetical protein AVEN_7641-1 [Araneus ventricosus]|uniref:Uncharacterized protein n=1 Tax=Araneus ventricosus TaxID=182803 RepID=A0A4Y2T2S8_ARAVE|nr:hypothetical protein AVEN_7641-1 [Araneus ventricosus]
MGEQGNVPEEEASTGQLQVASAIPNSILYLVVKSRMTGPPDDHWRLLSPSDWMFTPKRLPADHLPDRRTGTKDYWPCVEIPRTIRNQPSWEHPVCPPKCNGGAGPWN